MCDAVKNRDNTNKTTVRFNAFDRHSNTSFSETVYASSVDELLDLEQDFDKKVPFSRFYFDHEFVDGDENIFNQFEKKSGGRTFTLQ
jgi:hypothetical protein